MNSNADSKSSAPGDTIEIEVFCEPKSESSDDSPNFTYKSKHSALKNEQGELVMPQNVRKILVRFKLMTPTIKWKSGTYAGTHPLTFGTSDSDPASILVVFTDGTKQTPVYQRESPFSRPQLAKDGMSISTLNDNSDQGEYFYQLSVGFPWKNGRREMDSDPRIKNGGELQG